jgi:hypothetical protein
VEVEVSEAVELFGVEHVRQLVHQPLHVLLYEV